VVGDDLFYNGQSDAGAHFAGLLGALCPVEFLEYILDFFGIDAYSLVAHGNSQFFASALR